MAAPLPLCYLNGEYLPLAEARISPLDRGFLYADGVYEVMPVYGGRPFRFAAHQARLARSLAGIRMEDPHSAAAVACDPRHAGRAQRRRRPVRVLAGHARRRTRAQPRPAAECRARCSPSARRCRSAPRPRSSSGVSCVTAEDTRWARCDIKSTALLANVLLRQLAVDAGAAETILLRDGRADWRPPPPRCTWCSTARSSCRRTRADPARHHARGGGGAGRALRRSATASPRSARRSCAPPRRSGSRPPRARCRR